MYTNKFKILNAKFKIPNFRYGFPRWECMGYPACGAGGSGQQGCLTQSQHFPLAVRVRAWYAVRV